MLQELKRKTIAACTVLRISGDRGIHIPVRSIWKSFNFNGMIIHPIRVYQKRASHEEHKNKCHKTFF